MTNLVRAHSETDVIELDLDQCNGYGNCVFAAPAIFELDLASNLAVLLKEELTEAERSAAIAAIADCPAAAIRMYPREA